MAVSIDRFLAIHLHLRYQELVTHKRVVVVVILLWVMSAFLLLTSVWIPVDNFLLVKLVLGVIGLVLTTVAYVRVYLAVRHHKGEIQALQVHVQQVAENSEVANLISLIKSAVGIFFIYLVFLICYLPNFITLVFLNISDPSITSKFCFIYLRSCC